MHPVKIASRVIDRAIDCYDNNYVTHATVGGSSVIAEPIEVGGRWRQLVSVRGTDDLSDVISDFSAISQNVHCEIDKTWMSFAVHFGFCHHARLAAISLRLPINKLDLWRFDPGVPTIFQGHSLGGAVAAILPGLLSMDPENVLCLTYGAPRLLRTIDAWKYPYNCWQFIRQYDPVPCLPVFPWRLLRLKSMIAYAHPGREVYLRDSDKKMTHRRDLGAWTMRVTRRVMHVVAGRGISSIKFDHSLSGYREFFAADNVDSNLRRMPV